MAADADKLMKDMMAKSKALQGEKDDLSAQVKLLMRKIKDLEEEVEDAIASAEAANMGKSAVERDWTERLVKTEQEWATKLKRAEEARSKLAAEKDAALAAAERSREEALAAARAEMQQALAAKEAALRQALEAAGLKEVDALKAARTQHEAAAQQLRQANQGELQALQARCDGDLTRAQQAAAQERSALEATFSARLEQQEEEHRRALAAKDEERAAGVAEAAAHWRRQLDEAHTRFAEERAKLTAEGRRGVQEAAAEAAAKQAAQDKLWRERLAAQEAAAADAAATARADIDARVEAIHARMADMVAAEAKRERRRAALAAEVEALRESAEEEFRRRCDCEAALRKAAALFKRELFEKNEALASLQDEVACMRKWRTKGGAIAAGPPCPEVLDHVATGGYTAPVAGRLSPQEQPCCRSATCSPRARQACSPVRRSATRPSPGRGGCGGRGNVDFDTWHEELSERLDTAMRRLSPMLGSPD